MNILNTTARNTINCVNSICENKAVPNHIYININIYAPNVLETSLETVANILK